MHDLRFAPRTLLAILACTLALGLAACSDGDSGASAPPSSEVDRPAAGVDDEVVGVFTDPAVPVEGIAVDDVFVLALEQSGAEGVRWTLSPRPDIAYVLAKGGSATPGDADPPAQSFEFLALGPGTFELSFKEVKGMFGEATPDARTATFTVTIDDPSTATS